MLSPFIRTLDIASVLLAFYMLYAGARSVLGTVGLVTGTQFGMLAALVHLVALMAVLAGLLVVRHWISVLDGP